jgi:hypothetical protein
MAVTGYLFDTFPYNCMKKLINDMSAVGTSIKVALCTSSYTPSQTTHSSYNDLTDEVSGVGYTTGGATLNNKTLTVAAHICTFDADDAQWANSTITARYAVIYDATTSGAANQKLIGYIDFGVDYSSSAATFQLVFNSGGILTWTVS